MSQVVNTILSEETVERLQRFARRLGKTASETGSLLIEESLREQEFPYIEFHNSGLGRQAFLKNSSLAVWEVIEIAQNYQMNQQKTAEHFHRTLEWTRCAFLYYEAFPQEVELAVADAQAINQKTLERLLPQLETITIQ